MSEEADFQNALANHTHTWWRNMSPFLKWDLINLKIFPTLLDFNSGWNITLRSLTWKFQSPEHEVFATSPPPHRASPGSGMTETRNYGDNKHITSEHIPCLACFLSLSLSLLEWAMVWRRVMPSVLCLSPNRSPWSALRISCPGNFTSGALWHGTHPFGCLEKHFGARLRPASRPGALVRCCIPTPCIPQLGCTGRSYTWVIYSVHVVRRLHQWVIYCTHVLWFCVLTPL